MKYTSINYKAFTFCLLSCSFSIVSAETAITIDSDDIAQKVFLGAKWKCKDFGNFTQENDLTIIVFEMANKRKVKGKVWKAHCPEEPGKLSGKIKKNIVTYKMKSFPKGCWGTIKGKLEIYKDDTESLVAEGTYNGPVALGSDKKQSLIADGRLVCKKE